MAGNLARTSGKAFERRRETASARMAPTRHGAARLSRRPSRLRVRITCRSAGRFVPGSLPHGAVARQFQRIHIAPEASCEGFAATSSDRHVGRIAARHRRQAGVVGQAALVPTLPRPACSLPPHLVRSCGSPHRTLRRTRTISTSGYLPPRPSRGGHCPSGRALRAGPARQRPRGRLTGARLPRIALLLTLCFT